MTYSEALQAVQIVDHPVVQTRLTILRSKDTPTEVFRSCLREISVALALTALAEAQTRSKKIETPMGEADGVELARPVVIIPILRAGLGFTEGMMQILPEASIGHIGMFRNETTHRPEQYYFRVPPGFKNADVLLVDPMLATGFSAAEAVSLLKKSGARFIRFVGLVGCPQGVANLQSHHPEVPIFLAALDPGLDENCYIVPGLGDAGDRYFGTE